MNYLALVQRFRQEVNYSNTGPSTVLTQTGDHARAVSWIADNYTELQNRYPWRWLRERFTLDTVAAQSVYAYGECISEDTALAITRFKEWHVDDQYNRASCYLKSSGDGTNYWLTYISWEQYQTVYKIGNVNDSSPIHITIDPQQNLVLGPAPNDVYVIESEYHKSAQILAADADIPEMPSDYHMLIVYLAMLDGGLFDAADEIVARARMKSRKLIRQLEGNQAPIIRMAGAMA